MMRRSVWSSAAIVTLVLAACGGEKKAESPPAAEPAAAAPAPAQATGGLNGADEYAVCSVCHQPTGQGLPGAFPPLAGSAIINGPAEVPIAIVLHGLQGPIKVKGVEFNGQMAAWAQLSDDQIAAILTYERSSWGNAAPAVVPADVAAVRAATASRTNPWTEPDLKAAKLK